MDSVSGYAGSQELRSGGKIVRPRRNAVIRTPYERPVPRSRDLPQQNPSWISRLVYKPASVIASGAGKFISSVVFSESSSSSSENGDLSSDIEGDEDFNNNTTDLTEKDFVNDQQRTIQRLSSKRVIEQLLMQETFAREEGDKLIEIINARVVDHHTLPAAVEGNRNDYGLTSDVNVGEMSNKAVMEAQKWLEEKTSDSSSKYKATADGAGSPVDVAKSYMRARLPWGSLAVGNLEFRSPSSAGMQLLKEGSPFPYSGGNISFSKLKRKSGSNQSWYIHEEIRKVRAKATEEMLKNPSSVASLEAKHSPCALATALNADGSVQAVRNEQNGVLPNSIIPTSEQNETTEVNPATEETGFLHTTSREGGLGETFISMQRVEPSEYTNTAPRSGTSVNDFNGQYGEFIQPNSTIGGTPNAVLALGTTLDPTGNICLPKDVFETSKEADEDGAERLTSNEDDNTSYLAKPFCFSLPVDMEGQPKSKPPGETKSCQPIAGISGDDMTVGNGSDGAINNENDDGDSSASHNSSSTHEEEWLPGGQSLPNSNSASSSPGTTKVLAYSRRGRGCGRGRDRGVRGKGRAKSTQ